MKDVNINTYAYQDMDLVTRAIESVPDGIEVYVIDGRLGTFKQIDGTDTTPGLKEWCDIRDNVIYAAPPDDLLPYGGDDPDIKKREDTYKQAEWAFCDVLPQDEWTVKLDSDEILHKLDMDMFSDLDEEEAYRPLWSTDGGRKVISPRIRVPENWTPYSHDMHIPRDEVPRTATLEGIWRNRRQEQDTEVVDGVVIEHRGGDRSEAYMESKVEQMRNLGMEHRATKLSHDHGISDPVTVAHIVPDVIDGCSSRQVELLMKGMSSNTDILNVAVSTRQVPVTSSVDSYGMMYVYPNDTVGYVRDMDPDVVLVQTYDPALFSRMDVDSHVVLCNSGNVGLNEESIRTQTDLISFADTVVSRSEMGAKEVVVQSHSHTKDDVYHIPPVVDVDRYNPKEMKDDTIKVVVPGYKSDDNRVANVAIAVDSMRRSGNMISAIIIDGADPRAKEGIKSLCKNLNGVDYDMELDVEERTKYMNISDIVAIPSKPRNSVPAVALEGMASGSVSVCGKSKPVTSFGPAIIGIDQTTSYWKEVFMWVRDNISEANTMIENATTEIEQYDYRRVVEDQYKPLFEEVSQ